MDRATLVLRNQRMTEAFHQTPVKHQVRHLLLKALAQAPVRPASSDGRERILLIRPDHIGDVLLATPAIQALRAARPAAEIHALVGPWSADLLGRYSEVDRVLTLAFPGFTRDGIPSELDPYRLALKTAGQLRRIGYSHAVILRPDHWWGAATARLAGIGVRIGYDLNDVGPFLSHRIPFTHRHTVEQNGRLMALWTGEVPAETLQLHFPVGEDDRVYIARYLAERGATPDRPLVCIHAGTGTAVKHWDEERWARVADVLSGQWEATIVLTGGPHEIELARRLAGMMDTPPIVMTGDTDLGQLAALFERAKLVLGPDSGPVHLAVAVGTPTVALYGPADPNEFGSWGPAERHAVLTSDIGCRPCRVLDWSGDKPEYHPCLRDIPVSRVLEAARRVVT